MSNPILSEKDLDDALDRIADTKGNYSIGHAVLDSAEYRGTFARQDVWRHDWMPSSRSEMHQAKAVANLDGWFSNQGISIRAKRKKYHEIQGYRAQARIDADALKEAEFVEDFCNDVAMDAIEKYLVGELLVSTLKDNPDKHFTEQDLNTMLENAKWLLYSCHDDSEFLQLAFAAQQSHLQRYNYWFRRADTLARRHAYLRDVN